jgi:proteic killer suppression protein
MLAVKAIRFLLVILSFGNAATKGLYDGRRTARVRRFPPDIGSVTVRKLDMLNAARTTKDLRVPASNRFEHLKGSLKGFCSIRINDQWRIVFRWEDGNASGVRVPDYH